MAAAARYGTLTFKGNQTGRNYMVDFYCSDVVGAQVTFDSGLGASSTSLTFVKLPEDMTLVDASVASGLTDTTTWVPTKDGGILPTQRLRHANFLNSLAFRPAISMRFPAGTNFGMIQQ